MAGRKMRSRPARKEKYKKQYDITEANKKRKLAKHIKHNPNDAQAKAS